MTLSDAIQSFESGFSSVSSDQKAQFDPAIPVLWSGGPRAFNETATCLYAMRDAAIQEWFDAAVSLKEGSKLKWIVRPELLEFQITIADKNGAHRAVSNRFAVKSQFTTGEE